MPDVHSPEARSRNMSAVRGKDTKPEMLIRSELHRRGYRYRLHVRDLPGRPDLVFPKFGAALFVHGCFWHAHACNLFRLPGTRRQFWQTKLEGNLERDRRSESVLHAAGWRVGVIWECALRGPTRLPEGTVADRVESWLNSDCPKLTIGGAS
jgi:DNA mismatch endonuclease (patch repair protein)